MRNYLSNEALSEPCLRNLILAPMLGGLFLMFLPAIGFYLVGKKLVGYGLSKLNRPVPMAAGEVYLTGHPTDDKVSEPSTDTKLDGIADEIKKRRNGLDS